MKKRKIAIGLKRKHTMVAQKFFQNDQVFSNSVQYFNGDYLAADVWVTKYALRDKEGRLLEASPEDMHHRLAREFARIEKNKFKNPLSEAEIFALFDKFARVVPAGSPMSGIGNPFQVQSLGNCFALPPVQDSISGIYYTDQQLAQLSKRRAGVGFDISNLRPKGAQVKNAAKTTDGIGVFMEHFSNSCREIAQNGRRGSLLLCLSVHHPEIETFINIKRDLKKVTGANISVKITDEFMKAVRDDKEYELRWPVEGKPVISKKERARAIWTQIVDSAWESGEPGILFSTTIEKNSLAQHYQQVYPLFKESAANPCGEIHMGADSCRLMSMNLYSYVENKFTKEAFFSYERFEKDVELAQRLMDDLVDLEAEAIERIIAKIKADPESEHLKRIELETWQMFLENCRNGRRTGLGVTGLADCLAAMNIRYGSPGSIAACDSIFRQMAIASLRSSVQMARELGAFPIYDGDLEKNDAFLKRVFAVAPQLAAEHAKYGRRNISLTTCAPAGSISCLTRTSSGIEPVFMLVYKRRRKINAEEKGKVDAMGDHWQEYLVTHPALADWANATGKKDSTESPYHGATAADIDWEKSVEMQAAAQKWITHSISKTVNVPDHAPRELIARIYLRAWESGCKGLTVYRQGSRDGVLVANDEAKIKHTMAPKRPKELPCGIHHVKVTKDKKHYDYLVLVGMLGNDPYEVFAMENGHIAKELVKGKLVRKGRGYYSLQDEQGNTVVENVTKTTSEAEDALTRMLSAALRHGCAIGFCVHQLEKSQGDLFGFSKAIARTLKKYLKDGSPVTGEECPNCKGKLVRESGCISCKNCGWGRCG